MTNEPRPTESTEAKPGEPMTENRSDQTGPWAAAPGADTVRGNADPGSAASDAAAADTPQPDDDRRGPVRPDDPAAETDSPQPAPAAPPARRRSLAGVLVLPLVLAVLAGAAYLTRGQWLPAIESRLSGEPVTAKPPAAKAPETAVAPPPASPVDAVRGQVQALQTRIADLESTLQSVRQEIAAAPTSATDGSAGEALAPQLAALTQQDEELATRIAHLEQLSAAIQGLSERIGRLEQVTTQTAALETQVRTLTSQAQRQQENFSDVNATVLAVGQLAEAVHAGQPFVRPLAAVRSLAASDPDMAEAANSLQAHAAEGIATVPALMARFPATADAVARAAPATDGGAWTDRVVNQFASLLTIRTIGSTAARNGGLDAALSEAQVALDGGDLATAVAIVGEIEGKAAEPAADWLAAARARLAANQALATLQQTALERLNATKG